MDDSNRTCGGTTMEPTGAARRGEEGGVEGEGEVREETKGNMVDWMCRSRRRPAVRSVGRTVAWPHSAVTPAYKSALKMAPRRSSIAPVTT